MNKTKVLFPSLVVVVLLIATSVALWRIEPSEESTPESQTVTTVSEEGDAVSAPTKDTCIAEDCLVAEDVDEYPVDSLPQSVVDALDAAIDDEYKARATYEAVMDELGQIRPFSMIIRAEEQHISSLKSLYDKYGLDIPADPHSNIKVATTRSENCAIGVQAEIDNAALYRDQLLPAVEGYPDITSVFTDLMDASQLRHLPAFERCA